MRLDAGHGWTFEPLDEDVFAAVRLAREAVATSATHPAVYNAANEECVEAFLAGRIGFLDIVTTGSSACSAPTRAHLRRT